MSRAKTNGPPSGAVPRVHVKQTPKGRQGKPTGCAVDVAIPADLGPCRTVDCTMTDAAGTVWTGTLRLPAA